MAITKKSLMEELELMVRDDITSQETIIRLSKENKEYEKTIIAQDLILNALEKNIHKSQDRIDKAIEYIDKQTPYWEEWHYDGGDIDLEQNIKHIKNILEGKNNE